MPEAQKLLSADEVERLKNARGRDLRVEEAAERRRRDASRDNPFPGGDRARLFQQNLATVPAGSDPSPKPDDKKGLNSREECTLPPVGRHTEALEQPLNPYQSSQTSRTVKEGQDPKLSKRLGARPLSEVKKPKLSNDQEMKIEPGEQITSQETDVDIPELEQANSPSFASQARDVPTGHVLHIDMTQCDDEDDAANASDAPDELSEAHTEPNRQAAGIGDPVQFDAKQFDAKPPPKVFPALIHNDAAFNSVPPPPQVNYTAPQDMPPWLQDIHQGLQSLHTKADRQFATFSSELQSQHARLSHLEGISSEHTGRHEATESKVTALERKIRQLEESIENRSRSPAARFGNPGHRSPRSPRSLRQGGGLRFDEQVEEDLDLVFGGWTDARRDDAIEETRNILRDINSLELAEEIWSPYSRTSFVKVRLVFPDPEAHISKRRKFQTEILEKLKRKSYVSGVPGSEKTKLWMTKSKTPEERSRIRAIVLTKEFYKHLPNVQEGLPHPFNDSNIDISWNGKVFAGQHQLLGSIHREGEPGIHDVLLSDAKGNHLEWYLLSRTFAAASGRPADSLQDCWDRFGSSGVRSGD